MVPPPPLALRAHVWRHRRRIITGFALVLASVAIHVGLPFITRYAVDALREGAVPPLVIAGYAGAYLLAALAMAVCGVHMRQILLALGHQVEYEIRRDVFNHLTRMDAYFYQRERTGD